MKADKVLVTCPKCGHGQREPPAVYSTVCKKCRQHFRVKEAARPAAKVQTPPRELKHISCFKCGAALEVAFTAQSTMCKRCSSHVDLRDYHIANAVSKNFKTKGRFVIEAGGFLFNTDTIAGEAVLKGRLLGKLAAEYSLEIYSSAEIKGSFQTTRLIIPPGNHFRWAETISLLSAEVGGELVANLNATETVLLKSTGRFFGQIKARNLIVEEGAVLVASVKLGATNSEPVQLPLSPIIDAQIPSVPKVKPGRQTTGR